jgi:hypothetical protein
MQTKTIEYNKQTGVITLCTYTEDGFLENQIDITDKAISLVLEKLYNDYDLEDGDELLITKKEKLGESIKFEI